MKRKLTAQQLEKAGMTLADITSAAVVKNLVDKWSHETLIDLRRALQIDKSILKRAERIGEQTTALENRNKEIAKEIATLEKAASLIKERIKGEPNELKRAELICKYKDGKRAADYLRDERKNNSIEIAMLYEKFGETLGDGNDLKNVAVCGIWEHWEKVLEQMNGKAFDVLEYVDIKEWLYMTEQEQEQKFITVLAQEMGNIVVGEEYKTVMIKTADGTKAARDENGEIVKAWQEITLRKAAGRAVNRYINYHRSKIATNTSYIIVGEDEDGNELLVQATAMQTAGGVDSIEDAYDFELLLYKCEQLLTARQMEIIKLTLQGYKQHEIAVKLNVRESTINNHMAQIRERMTAAGVSLKK